VDAGRVLLNSRDNRLTVTFLKCRRATLWQGAAKAAAAASSFAPSSSAPAAALPLRRVPVVVQPRVPVRERATPPWRKKARTSSSTAFAPDDADGVEYFSNDDDNDDAQQGGEQQGGELSASAVAAAWGLPSSSSSREELISPQEFEAKCLAIQKKAGMKRTAMKEEVEPKAKEPKAEWPKATDKAKMKPMAKSKEKKTAKQKAFDKWADDMKNTPKVEDDDEGDVTTRHEKMSFYDGCKKEVDDSKEEAEEEEKESDESEEMTEIDCIKLEKELAEAGVSLDDWSD